MRPEPGQTVLILTAASRDAALAAAVLGQSGFAAHPCEGFHDLCQRLPHAGTLILSDDVLTVEGLDQIGGHLARQPTWSDLPVILLVGRNMSHAGEVFSQSGNISLLERPFSRLTLVRAVEVALRARRRQYEVRDLLAALERSKNEAERANGAKSQFLANMSHEIRTPIGAMLGFLELMKDPANSPETNLGYMGVVERNSQQLLRLIDDILDLSKVEAGKMIIEHIPFSLVDLLGDLASLMSYKTAEKGVDFRLEVQGEIPDRISTDPVRLRQVLSNVLGNAVKFTERGEVRLVACQEGPDLFFTITDTGLGISPEQKEKLFRPFSQADTSTTRRFGGTGLGLVLSRRLAQALGGDLWLEESRPGQGSTFKVRTRPSRVEGARLVGDEALRPGAPVQVTDAPAQILRGMKVLLVEDSPDNQILINTYLKQAGAIPQCASNGQEGVDMALAEFFDIVLMDVQMPRMDGHAATQLLRARHYSRPIIALTAHAMEEERDRCFASGFTDFLTKPIQRSLLVSTLERYLPKTRNL